VIFRLRQPSPPLRPFVENFWYHQDQSSSHSYERLLPDGAIELIFDLTETAKRWVDSDTPRQFRKVRGSWISGQHSRHIVIEAVKKSCMIGARFRPGGAYPFLDVPVSDLNDDVIEMDGVWGTGAARLRERLVEACSIEERFDVLERALLLRAGDKLLPDPALRCALERLTREPGEVGIRALADGVGMSQKCLVRTFEEKVGLKPKTFARVMRFQTVLKKVERESRVSWSFIAGEAGYYDQAHFIREFEALSGLRPSQYLVERGEYLNFVPLR
jgi:AraC-like DNA-binding protein